MKKSMAMLKLKLVNPPVEQLTKLAEMMRLTRNVGVEDWLLRHRGKPESDIQATKSTRRKSGFIGPLQPRDKHPATKIYNAMVAANTGVVGDVIAKLSSDLWSNLSAKVDWRKRAGKPRTRADAIIDYEDRPPWHTSVDIPVLNKHAHVEFDNDLTLTLRRLSHDPELSDLSLTFSMKGFPPRLKKLIRQVMSGELKFSDSSIRLKPSGEWYWYWPIKIETEQRCDASVTATLIPSFDGSVADRRHNPFAFTHQTGTWNIGDGRYLLAQMKRLIGLRKDIGYRYRHKLATGHGRTKYDVAVSKRRKQQANVCDEFRRKAVSDVIKQCERHGIGTLVYREPYGPGKTKCWFERNGLEFDWTSFLTDLKNSCHKRGISVEIKKLKIKEILDSLKDDKDGDEESVGAA